MKQVTIYKTAIFEGIGLHMGQNVTLTIHPAPVNHGVVFVRTDLETQPKIPATIKHIDYRQRRTALVCGDAEIQTPEHFLAACNGLGIDNLLVEINGCELPGADGSALPFCEVLLAAGKKEQSMDAKCIKVSHDIEIKLEKATIKATPSDLLHIDYTLDHDLDFFPTQNFNLEMTQENFLQEIAPARTFVLKREVEALWQMGLGKGANTKNTLVIDDNGKIMDNTLRFANEFTRHKILDIIGDLFLLGARLQGNITAHRSGHNLNAKLVEQITNT